MVHVGPCRSHQAAPGLKRIFPPLVRVSPDSGRGFPTPLAILFTAAPPWTGRYRSGLASRYLPGRSRKLRKWLPKPFGNPGKRAKTPTASMGRQGIRIPISHLYPARLTPGSSTRILLSASYRSSTRACAPQRIVRLGRRRESSAAGGGSCKLPQERGRAMSGRTSWDEAESGSAVEMRAQEPIRAGSATLCP